MSGHDKAVVEASRDAIVVMLLVNDAFAIQVAVNQMIVVGLDRYINSATDFFDTFSHLTDL